MKLHYIFGPILKTYIFSRNAWGSVWDRASLKVFWDRLMFVCQSFSQPPTQPVSDQTANQAASQRINKLARGFIYPSITVTGHLHPFINLSSVHSVVSISLSHSLSSLLPPSVCNVSVFVQVCGRVLWSRRWASCIKMLRKEICFYWKTQNRSHFFILTKWLESYNPASIKVPQQAR